MPEYSYSTDLTNFNNQGLFDSAKPATNTLLLSEVVRNNFQGLSVFTQDFKYRCFSNNAVGKRTVQTRTDFPAIRWDCWFVSATPAIARLGVPIISQWITPNKVGNKVWVEASIFGEFEENIAFHVTRSTDATFTPGIPGSPSDYWNNSVYLNSLKEVHPRYTHTPWFDVPQAEAVASARLASANGTDPQTISFAVEDPIEAIGTGYCYTVWAKATAGYGSRAAPDPLVQKQSFKLNQSDPTIGGVPVEVGITTLTLTELWYISEA